MATVVRFPSKKPDYSLFEPPAVRAPSPTEVNELVSLEISRITIQKYIDASLRIPIFQAWAHLVGVVPPIPNSFKMAAESPGHTLKSIADASACFRGVRRPYGDEDDGDDVLVYSIATHSTVVYAGIEDRMACFAKLAPAPVGAVMTVQVRPALALQPTQADVWGTITKWEFVDACSEHPTLPRDFTERYNHCLWQR